MKKKLTSVLTAVIALSICSSAVISATALKSRAEGNEEQVEKVYGDNLVTNSEVNGFTGFKATAPAGKAKMVYGQYEDKPWYNMYARPAVNGGAGEYVKTETDTYANLCWDGTATGDSLEFWIQPGKLGAGKFTIEIEYELVGFSTGDYLEYNVDATRIVTIMNANAYADQPDSENAGHKSAVAEYTAGENDFHAMHIWFFHKNTYGIQVHLFEVTYKNEVGDVVYSTDFSEPFVEAGAEVAVGNDKGYNNATNTTVVYDGNQFALKMTNAASFNTPIVIDGVGKYKISMLVKPSDDFTGPVKTFLAAVDSIYNTAIKTIAQNKLGVELLEESSRDGWYEYTTEIMVNNFQEPHILSLFTMKEGEGSFYIDNLTIEKKLSSVIQETTPSTEGLEFIDIVQGGDFEYLDEGYTFVGEPQADSNFWGSTVLDSAGKIVKIGDNKVLKIVYDGTSDKRWASAFVFLDPSKFNVNDVFTLSYKYKYEGKDGFNPGIGLQCTFIGATGAEHYVQYLYYTDELKETSGVNPSEWPYTVTALEDGWNQVTLTFKMNADFISQVDSIRFLNYNNKQADVVLYVDDVSYGVWTEPKTDDNPGGSQGGNNQSGNVQEPDNEEKEKSSGCGSSLSLSVPVIALVTLGGAIVFGKKRSKNE